METAALQIRLLGGVDLRYDGDALPAPESVRAVSLLAYLLLHRHAPQSRERLAFLLWPDSSEPQARTNLRHVLHHLRRALPDSDRFLTVTTHALQWQPDASYWLDVAAFEALAASLDGITEDKQRLTRLQDAVEIYRGDLLEGWYDEWVLSERERLSQLYLWLLEQLVGCLEACGDLAGATQHAEQLLRHDPLNEGSYRLLMRLFAAQGDRARALRLYHICVTTMQRELGVEPSALTQNAYRTLLPATFDPIAAQEVSGTGSPLVGRAEERRRLAGLWRAAEGGHAQCVLLSGESGVGKTRLAEELRTWCVHRGAAVAAARSYAAEGALAYAPVVAWLRSDPLAERRETLNLTILAELARLLPELSAEVPGLPAPPQLSEAEQRQRLFDALVKAILVVDEPLLLVADDIHWADRETLQFVHYLLRASPDARLLILATARQEEIDNDHPIRDLALGLQALDRYTEITIDRFAAAETASLAEQLAGRTLSEHETDQLHRETEGNPLFIVEAIRAGWTDSHQTQGWITPRVQAVIQARLAKLSEPTVEMASIAATIGREFTIDVLSLASGRDDETMIGCLDELWQRRIIREQGVDGYDFTHDKLREVAYAALSPARRRHVHQRIANALERLHADDPGRVSGQLAAHYEQAGAGDAAVAWYVRAAEAAQQMQAHSEAIRLLRRGIDLNHSLPETRERQERELAMLTALLGPLVAIRGFQSDDGERIHEQAMHLTQMLGVEPAPPLLWSVAVSNLVRGNLSEARIHGEHLRARGERDADDVIAVQGLYVLGITAYWNAEFLTARSHFESVIARFKFADLPTHLLRYGNDPALVCKMRLAFALWFLGRTADARRHRDEAFERAVDHDDWFTRLGVLHFAGLLSIEIGDHEYVRECNAVIKEISEAFPTMYVQHNGEAIAGYVDILNGRRNEGMQRIERALDDLRDVVQLPGQRSSVARVHLAARVLAGDPHAGMAAAERLLTSGVGDRIWEAEAHRARAEFMAALGSGRDEVEAELDLALRVARRQQALALELRVATSLLRYRLSHGDEAEISDARDLLAGVVSAVSDGSDTNDLRKATSLLAAVIG
jgi:DNA-binding SARP family transcriptional activator